MVVIGQSFICVYLNYHQLINVVCRYSYYTSVTSYNDFLMISILFITKYTIPYKETGSEYQLHLSHSINTEF